ncbi:MAG: SGNH/GDSL hydrolase family protein [Sphingobacteriaceae bacterium]|nr:MAG: SGNH/GDSL hydrolase family protein [Sphingobacteriaceae bacterium]
MQMNDLKSIQAYKVSLLIGVILCCNALLSSAQTPDSGYFKTRAGLANTYRLIEKEQKVIVAFFGGSITFNPGWREMVCTYLKERFPAVSFKFINAGIPSLGSLPHAFRLQTDVLDPGKPDLLFVEAAVNDRVNGTDSLTQIHALEGIVRHAKKSDPSMDIVLMSFTDPDKTADYKRGITPVEVMNHELVAAHYGLPSINLAKEVYERMERHEFSWENDFKDLHPSNFGQLLYFSTIKKMLEVCFDNAKAYDSRRVIKGMPKPLDKANYDNGKYLDIKNAHYDNNWTLDNHWQPADSLATRPGFVRVPMLTTEKAGASLSLQFKGSAIGMAVVSGADAGVISYSIDGGPYKETDLFTQWSNMLHLPWYVLFKDNLPSTLHTLTIKVNNQKNINSKGNACRIVRFIVNT